MRYNQICLTLLVIAAYINVLHKPLKVEILKMPPYQVEYIK